MNTLDHSVALPSGREKTAAHTNNWAAKLPTLLRILGTAALVIAMYSFLIKGWQSGNDVFRYLMMLGHTALLTALGLFSGHWLKESKSARLLLTLGLVSVPVNFAILGAFIYSQIMTESVAHFPYAVFWQIESLRQALLVSFGALAVLIPVVLLGFSVLLRHLTTSLSLLFLVSNAVLLIPTREPLVMAALILMLTTFTLWFNRRTTHQHITARTNEGIIALSLQLLPLTVLAVRSLWLYSADLLLLTMTWLTLFLIMRQIAMLLAPSSRAVTFLNALSLLLAGVQGVTLGAFLLDSSLLPLTFVIPLSVSATALMVYDIAQRSNANATLYRRLATGVIVVGNLINLWFFASSLANLVCLASGLALGYRGFVAQQRSLAIGGVLLSTLSVVYQAYLLVATFDFNHWYALAGLGIAAILAASLIESQSSRVKTFIRGWRERFANWEN